MAFLQSSAADMYSLLATVADFAVDNGWTAEYNDAVTTGQIGLSKGAAKVAIGIKVAASTGFEPSVYTGTNYNIYDTSPYEDMRLCMVVLNELNPSNRQYWGHPGSDCTSYVDTDDYAYVNDLKGPFPNVYLFSPADGNAITVIVQTTADRFTHFSFGVLDKQGLTHGDCAYVMGQYYYWWGNSSNGPSNSSYGANNIAYSSHQLGFQLETNAFFLQVPAGVLDPTYGFPSVDTVFRSNIQLSQLISSPQWDADLDTSTAAIQCINDFFSFLTNQNVVGGMALFDIPVIINNGSTTYQYDDFLSYLGRIPDMRVVHLDNLNPAQEVKVGSDTWQVFPIKRKSDPAFTYLGATPDYYPSTGYHGIAIKKVL